MRVLWLWPLIAACVEPSPATLERAAGNGNWMVRVPGLDGEQLTVDGVAASRVDDELSIVVRESPGARLVLRDRDGGVLAEGVLDVALDRDRLDLQEVRFGNHDITVSNFQVDLERTVGKPGDPLGLHATIRAPGGDAIDPGKVSWYSRDSSLAHVIPDRYDPYRIELVHILEQPAPFQLCIEVPIACWDWILPRPNHAAPFRRDTYGGLAINPREFAHGDHTITIRFLAQYARYLEGVLFANGFLTNNGGAYWMAIGGGGPVDEEAANRVWFQLQLDDQHYTFTAPWFEGDDWGNWMANWPTQAPPVPAKRWHQLAIVREGDSMRVYLDAMRLVPAGLGNNVIPAPATIRDDDLVIGNGPAVYDQFYGLVDDVAVFSRAMTDTELFNLAANSQITGDEPDLVAATLFDGPDSRPQIRQHTHLSLAAVAVSSNRDAASDRTRFPKPLQYVTHQLPFLPGEAWIVFNGNGDNSHRGPSAHSWDFARIPRVRSAAVEAGLEPASSYFDRVHSHGARVLGTMSGTVTARRIFTSGTISDTSDTEGGLHVDLDADDLGLPRVQDGDRVDPATVVSQIWHTQHMHYSSYDFGAGMTWPMEFSDYEVSNNYGRTWTPVASGAPTVGQWVRRPVRASNPIIIDSHCTTTDPAARARFHCDDPDLDVRLEPSVRPAVVSRAPGRLDVAVRAHVKRVMTWHWNGAQWSSVSHFGQIMGSPVLAAAGASRVIMVVRDATHNEWERGPLIWKSFDGASWTHYQRIADEEMALDPAIASRAAGSVDVASVGIDGKLWWRHFDGTSWGASYTEIAGPVALAGTPALIALGPNRLDVLVRGTDDRLYHATFDGTAWSPLAAVQPNPIVGDPTVVSAAPNRLDVIARGTDDALYQITKAGTAPWSAYAMIAAGPFAGDATAVAWGPNRIDVFARRKPDGSACTIATANLASWTACSTQLGSNPIASSVGVAAWSANRLDIFALGTDHALYTKSWTGSQWTPSYTPLGVFRLP